LIYLSGALIWNILINLKGYSLNVRLKILMPVFILYVVAISCNPTKYVPEDQTLLDRNELIIKPQEIKKADLLPYIRQKPNDRIFGARFYLGLYNLSNIDKTKWPHGWLRQIGEEPVIFDPNAAAQSADQLKSFIASKGYFDSSVADSINTEDRRTTVHYNIRLLPPYTIRKVNFEITDSVIATYFFFDSVNCLIQPGKPYDVNLMQQERARFERHIRDQGFYAFSREFITFDVDTTVGDRKVDIYYNIRNNLTVDKFNRETVLPHNTYRIRNIYIYPDYDPGSALQRGEGYIQRLDTIEYNGYYFITSRTEKPFIKFDLILQTLYLRPGLDYSLSNTDQTQAHLMSLKVYRLVNIGYNEVTGGENQPPDTRNLDCNIMLTLLTPQSYRVELEGTHSSGNIGGAMNLVYQHKNLFRGAELFGVKLHGAYEALSQTGKLKAIQEYGVETSLRLPQFLLPFIKGSDFIKKYNPSTNILVAYNHQEMPLFTRTLATATFGYNWRAGRYLTHIVTPLQLNFVKVPQESLDPVFRRRIESSFQAYSYSDVLILGGGYSYIFNNQSIQRVRAESDQYVFLRFNFETAGNLNSLIDRVRGAEKSGDTTFMFLGQPYAQYVKADMDLRYNYRFNAASSIVYRGFLGMGVPYGNSRAIPFEKQYFGGGANSIRGWQVRSLGPGSYDAYQGADPDTTFLNQTADIKLELNAEYRFKLFWILEGALFVDAGNIWTYNNDPARPGTQFSIGGTSVTRPFYKDIAIGAGTGFRFDFKFFIGRLDLGMKLRDPRAMEGWIIGNRRYKKEDFALVFGIGYPF
jgi:outer membrane protein assembly factor BamA